MKMLKDHELFVLLCEKRGLKPPSDVLEAIKNASATGELQLSRVSILVPICEVIAQVLMSSSAIKRMDLSDCMLNLSKSLSCILNALCEGSNMTSLNLKGNNIHGPTVAQLGQVLVHNNTLKLLNVEWNSLGSHVDSFTKFCDGLTKNHNIEELDLRYNQISPYCAEALCKVLKLNKSLKVLDLAWNTIGLQGGQLLLTGMQENKNIVKLNLHGNCIPADIVHLIEERTRSNQSRRMISVTSMTKEIEKAKSFLQVTDNKEKIVSFTDSDSTIQSRLKYRRKKKKRVELFKKEIPSGVTDDSMEKTSNESDTNSLTNLLVPAEENLKRDEPRNDISGDDSRKNNKICSSSADAATNKIKELNQILQDRTTAINLLTNEVGVKAAEIEAVRSQIDQLRTELERVKEERDKLTGEKTREILDLKENHKEIEEGWKKVHKELEDAYHKALLHKKEYEVRIRRYERDIHRSSLEISSLKEKIISITQTYEDLVLKDKTEMHRLRREIKERESRHKNEISIVKNTLRDTTQALEDCQMQLQKSRSELRDVTESQLTLKAKINEMEHLNVRYSRSEESLHRVKEEKENLEEKIEESQRTVSSLQRQVVALQSELVEPQRRYELLNDELIQEKEKTGRLKEELAEERERAKEQSIQIQKMTLQITALNTQINDIRSSHADTLRERDKERTQLKDIIAMKEREINDLKAEEVQRAGQLYAAFSKYLGSRGPNPVL
ncbi:leucine-rich repeat-containing protein 45-like [Neodiprion pinetum]|uniref:leucine-rich repeat-containing protein 45-like n=1 Tax=Neodiprion pinetum TaxID=441929 RepID=UPI001EE0724A|nr:leucine-rich repeat-containing protein 45-like [Neodiprion pinetum]